jgi:type I restriction enzyme S subunit
MTDLPTGWSYESINSIVEGGMIADGDWVESKDQDPQGKVRLTQLADVGDGEFRSRGDRWMNDEQASRLNVNYLQPGDLLLARMPDPLGRTCMVPENIGRAVTVVDVAIIRIARKDLNPKFVMWLLNSPGIRQQIEMLASGTTRRRITRKNLGTIDLPLPPLPEQQKIVEIVEDHLSRLDAALADVKQAKLKAAQFRRSLLQASLNGFLNNGQKDEVSRLPKNWRIKTLSEVADWTSGGTPSSKDATLYGGDIPWVVIGDLTEGVVLETEKMITKKGLNSSSAKKLPAGTVMVAMYGASIGRTGVMGKEMTTNQAIACGIPNNELILGQYLLYFLQSQKNEFIAAGKGGAQPNISQGVVKSWQIPLPPIDEQQQIINEIDSQLEHLAQANNVIEILIRESTALRRSLLQAAFTGQLTNEVASV